MPAGELGAVCGVQTAVQACFETASFLAGTFLRDPVEFWALMAGSLGVTAAAAALYGAFVARGARREREGYAGVATQEGD